MNVSLPEQNRRALKYDSPKWWVNANLEALKDFQEGKFKMFNSVIDLLKELRWRKR